MNKDGTLTLAEVAAAVADDPSPEARDLCIRRVRHWGSHGVLETAGEVFTGSGRYRRFAPETTYMAKVLLRLADAGLSLRQLKAVAASIALSRAASKEVADRWDEAIKAPPGSRIIARCGVGGGANGRLLDLTFKLCRDAPDVAAPTEQERLVILIDLTRAFAEVRL
jgi:DNA-binding transcriptional MerR regulator